MTLARSVWLSLLMFGTGCCSAVHGDVEHPAAGKKNTVDYCKQHSSQENNCMACASKPGCGYCAAPAAGSDPCQPGVPGDETPSTCAQPLTLSTDACAAPPPPL
jgi:hypothetical protein